MENEIEPKGDFLKTLQRNNKQIRDDRAKMIYEDAKITYRRRIEDLEMRIRRRRMERNQMLDLSPTDAQSLIMASDFNSEEYVKKDLEIGVTIRNEEIQLEIARARFETLFGKMGIE